LLIDQLNTNLKTKQRYYPGSGTFAALLKRPQDRLILNELTDEPFQALKKFFRSDAHVHCHQQDAYQILKALLPPKEKRGLVFIDPPYENPNEFDTLLFHLTQALKLWPQGVYALWYPIKEMRRIEIFAARLAKAIDCPQENFICCPLPSDVGQRLSGSGMLIINPPWQIEQLVNPLIQELCALFKEFNQ
jgi:23S rRNA (adenine2030-N6)-methyltransferase